MSVCQSVSVCPSLSLFVSLCICFCLSVAVCHCLSIFVCLPHLYVNMLNVPILWRREHLGYADDHKIMRQWVGKPAPVRGAPWILLSNCPLPPSPLDNETLKKSPPPKKTKTKQNKQTNKTQKNPNNNKPCHTARRIDQQGTRPLGHGRKLLDRASPGGSRAGAEKTFTGSTTSNIPTSTSKTNLLNVIGRCS